MKQALAVVLAVAVMPSFTLQALPADRAVPLSLNFWESRTSVYDMPEYAPVLPTETTDDETCVTHTPYGIIESCPQF